MPSDGRWRSARARAAPDCAHARRPGLLSTALDAVPQPEPVRGAHRLAPVAPKHPRDTTEGAGKPPGLISDGAAALPHSPPPHPLSLTGAVRAASARWPRTTRMTVAI